MGAMLGLEPIVGRSFVQKAGYVVDLPLRAVALDVPNALRNLLGLKNYVCVCHQHTGADRVPKPRPTEPALEGSATQSETNGQARMQRTTHVRRMQQDWPAGGRFEAQVPFSKSGGIVNGYYRQWILRTITAGTRPLPR